MLVLKYRHLETHLDWDCVEYARNQINGGALPWNAYLHHGVKRGRRRSRERPLDKQPRHKSSRRVA